MATQTADKVFAKTATAHDGSTVTVFTGHAAITWSANGKSIATNTSGPFTQTLSADGLTLMQDFRGRRRLTWGRSWRSRATAMTTACGKGDLRVVHAF
ncbi:MAG: hypothetical protein ACTHPS_09460 [Streptosporangiaceae bacterium]